MRFCICAAFCVSESILIFGQQVSDVSGLFLLCVTLLITGIILCLIFHLLFFHIRLGKKINFLLTINFFENLRQDWENCFLVSKNMTTYTYIMLQRQAMQVEQNETAGKQQEPQQEANNNNNNINNHNHNNDNNGNLDRGAVRLKNVQISQDLPTYKNKYVKKLRTLWRVLFGKKDQVIACTIRFLKDK